MKTSGRTIIASIITLLVVSALSSAEETNLRQFIRNREQSKLPISRPSLVSCMPESKINDRQLEEELKKLLLGKYPEIKPEEIVRIVFPTKDWQVSHEDFTGRVRGRYLFVDVVITSAIRDEYYIVKINFMQRNKFLGFSFGDTYLRNLLSVDKIKKKDLDKVCK